MADSLASIVLRSELFAQRNGVGALELRGERALDLALFVNGAPLILDATEYGGSILRFTRLLKGAPIPEVDAAIAARAAAGFLEGESLHSQIRPLLDVLPNGDYTLSLEQVPQSHQGLCWEDYCYADSDKPVINYYPADDNYGFQEILIKTQRDGTLDDETILRYGERIEAGARPALITIGQVESLPRPRFVLDGHHKLEAYWLYRLPPVMLHITCHHIRALDFVDAEQFAAPGISDKYLEFKRERESEVHHRAESP